MNKLALFSKKMVRDLDVEEAIDCAGYDEGLDEEEDIL